MSVKYIKTQVDKKPVILTMNSCNLCPLLYYDSDSKTAKCSKFSTPFKVSKLDGNVIPTKINGYSYSKGVYAPLTKIEIPSWCKLSDNINDISKVETYVKSSQNTYRVIYDNVKELELLPYTKVQYDNTNLNLESKSNSNFSSKYGYKNEYKSAYVPPVTNKCSLCGELKNEVDRKTRHGMCNSCFENFNEDENKKYISFINNFRLKRKSTWIENVGKKVVNLNIF